MGLRTRLRSILESKTPLTSGDLAPELGIADADGKAWTLADLKGKPAVIYFYPKDDTPGCTREACAFRDEHAVLRQLGATVLGVSTDDGSSHRVFAQKFSLNFPLLSDTGGKVSAAWGAQSRLGSNARRVTFVLDRQGRIAHVFDPVEVDGHAEAVLKVLRGLSG